MKNETQTYTIALTVDQKRAFRLAAASENKPLSEWVRDALLEAWARQQKREAKLMEDESETR